MLFLTPQILYALQITEYILTCGNLNLDGLILVEPVQSFLFPLSFQGSPLLPWIVPNQQSKNFCDRAMANPGPNKTKIIIMTRYIYFQAGAQNVPSKVYSQY